MPTVSSWPPCASSWQAVTSGIEQIKAREQPATPEPQNCPLERVEVRDGECKVLNMEFQLCFLERLQRIQKKVRAL